MYVVNILHLLEERTRQFTKHAFSHKKTTISAFTIIAVRGHLAHPTPLLQLQEVKPFTEKLQVRSYKLLCNSIPELAHSC